MGALTAIDQWPARPAAAVVVGPDGVLDRHGPTDAVVPIASVTKPLFALSILVAVEEGSISLDEPAGPPGSTVRHLLAHASGLPPDDGPPLARPGTRRIYSNAGFDVLGARLHDRTAMLPAVYLREAVLGPLGMARTELRGSPAKDAWSSADDLARFACELLRPHVVAAATLDLATSVAFPGLAGVLPGFGPMTPNDWGLGFELRDAKEPHWTAPRCSPRTFGHFGRTGSFLWVDPSLALGLVCVTERPFAAWARERWPTLGDEVIRQWAGRPIT